MVTRASQRTYLNSRQSLTRTISVLRKPTEFAMVASSGVRERDEEVVRHASDSGVTRFRWSLNRFISLNTWVPFVAS